MEWVALLRGKTVGIAKFKNIGARRTEKGI